MPPGWTLPWPLAKRSMGNSSSLRALARAVGFDQVKEFDGKHQGVQPPTEMPPTQMRASPAKRVPSRSSRKER